MKIKIYLLLILIMSLHAVEAQIMPRFEQRDSVLATSITEVNADWVDLDSDGKFDLFTSITDTSGTVRTLLFRLDSFKLSVDTLNIKGYRHQQFKFADLNNDNSQDLVGFSPSLNDSILSVFYQTSSLAFREVPLTSSAINGFELIDLDRNGLRDIVYYGINEEGAFLNARINKGEGNWDAPISLDIEYGEISLVYAFDYDKNGFTDLLINSSTDTNFSKAEIWLNEEQEFTLSLDSVPSLQNLKVSKGDFTSNGKFDLTLSGQDSSGVNRTILLRNGAGTMEFETLNGLQVNNTFMADFTSDGKLDLAIEGVNADSANFLLVRTNADSFKREFINPEFNHPMLHKYADVDCDGDLDLMLISLKDTVQFDVYENVTVEKNFAPSLVSNHMALTLKDEVVLLWDSSTDDLTADSSLTYDVYLGTTDSNPSLLSPDFTLGKSLRSLVSYGNSGFDTEIKIKIPQPEMYQYGIQSIDNSFHILGCEGGIPPCDLGAVACGSFMLCEELAFESITTCPDSLLTFTAEDPNAVWYSEVRGFLAQSLSIQYQVTETDTLYVSVPGSTDCLGRKAWIINIEKLDLDDVLLCLNDIVNLTVPERYDSALWEFKGTGQVFNSKSIEFELLEEDSIVVTAFINDCAITDSIAVRISRPELILSSRQLKIFAGDDVSLIASGGVKYEWSPSETLDNANIPNPVASPQETTTYEVIITDSLGCTAIGEVLVVVEHQAFIPNLFTPNDDGKNDVLLVYGVELANSFEIKIFNRSGSLVFTTDNLETMITSGWDGSVNGKEQAAGVYYWEVQGTFPDGKDIVLNGRKKGAVYLVK